MLFNSQVFLLIFLPITVGAYWFFAFYHPIRSSAFRIILLIASWLFYAFWDVRLLPLLLTSIVINYLLIKILLNSKLHRKFTIISGVFLNLSVLAFFKYFNFFIENLPSSFGVEETRFNIILPLAISFFTFQQISSLVSAYKNNITPHSLLDYALFVSFFPQLVAGPIVRHNELIPQLQNAPDKIKINEKFVHGLFLLTMGLIKKVFLADQLARIATPIFDASLTNSLLTLEAWIATFAFGFQIYFDFSGYSDMAIGLALLFGIVLPINFRSPYKATSLIEFWRRWHITLSTFLRDFLYIPLGGNRRGIMRQYLALFTTMLLGGLWHGAGWNFIIWGGVHGIGLVINHTWKRTGVNLHYLLGWSITFLFTMVAFLIFRAENLSSIANLLISLVGASGTVKIQTIILNFHVMAILLISAIVALTFPEPHQLNILKVKHIQFLSIFMALLLVTIIVYLGAGIEQEFIYFQF